VFAHKLLFSLYRNKSREKKEKQRRNKTEKNKEVVRKSEN